MAASVGMAVSVSAQGIVPVDDEISATGNDGIIEVLKPYALSIGPKIGLNSSIAGDPDDMNLGMSGKIGFNAGAAFNLRFGRPAGRPFGTERFGIQLEALYSKNSLKTNVDDIALRGQWQWKICLCRTEDLRIAAGDRQALLYCDHVSLWK